MVLKILFTILIIYLLKNIIYVFYKILTRTKERSYNDFTKEELKSGFDFMVKSISDNVNDQFLQDKLYTILYKRWEQFKNLEFKVDGATFIKEQYGNYFNLWWFNHDARNKYGYVGKDIDNEMLDMMIILNVPQEFFRSSIWWFKFTWINVIRHTIRKNRKNELPNDLIKIR